MNNDSKPGLPMSSHFMDTDNQDQYKGEFNESLLPQLLQSPWAINFWLQFQTAQLQPHLQYAALARSLTADNPLDLSNKEIGVFNNVLRNEDDESQLTEKVSEDTFNKSNILRRNYTVEDLTQAVKDIRDGKLGTRRASVVYGIPRSTLRNKIYKLEAEGAIPSKVRRGKIAARRAEAEQKRCVEATAAAALLDTFSNQSDSSSSSPQASICPSSPDSTNSSVEGAVETPELDSKKSCSPIDPKWIETIWQNLFKTQNGVLPVDAGLNLTIVDANAIPTPTLEKPQKLITGNDDWKRSRPKRGQYRKYDKNALDEAVRSVRRGEMTVHRAGSFFGVPHSTLEYKVKERNLMRKKKDGLYNHDSSTSEDGSQMVTSTISEKSDSSSHTSTPIPFPISLV
uniref:HTH psq-type domain-containing protein n=1 Tax=Caenorhabditis tropicalis TaxID=1561998 RepID=A0A1I7U124_9PELO